MIRQIKIVKAFGKRIAENLALEEYLMTLAGESMGILFLWSCKKCVVIGRNQNPWRECSLGFMQENHIDLARRKSGGGAVYQDEGNLNISFICKEENYDEERQNHLWTDALEKMGLTVSVNGRNDIETGEGYKISGMAYTQSGDACLQHGTLLMDTDFEMMEKCLTPSEAKLQAKGIPSVRSRVANAGKLLGRNESNPEELVKLAADHVLQVVKELYPRASVEIIEGKSMQDLAEVKALTEKYASRQWNLGHKMEFSWEWNKRFSAGELQAGLIVKDGRIVSIKLFSDDLAAEYIEKSEEELRGRYLDKDFNEEELLCSLCEIGLKSEIKMLE